VRWGVTAALLTFALSKLHADQIVGVANARGFALLLVASIGLLIALALNTVRWLLVARGITLGMPWFRAFQWVLIGHFFNQVFPSSVGGDVVRSLVAGRGTGDLPSSIVSIALDRLVGLFALLALIAAGQFLIVRFDDPRLNEVALAAMGLGLCAIIALFALDRIFGRHFPVRIQRAAQRLSRDAHELIARPALSIPALCVSFAMQGINLGLIAFIANQLGANVTFSDALLVIPTVLLVASLPISLGGWGIRETGLAFGFTVIGQSSSIAVATSIIIGLANLISALPGVGVWSLLPPADRPVNGLGTWREPA
jgi:glycosyltransferase 2 family protein